MRNEMAWSLIGRGAAALTLIACTACGITVITGASRPSGDQPPKRATANSTTRPPSQAPTPPADAPAELLAKAETDVTDGRLDDAIALLESTAGSDRVRTPQGRLLRDAYNRRAVTRYGMDRIDDAIADMTRSLKIDPDQEDIRLQLARARERLERLKALP